MPNTGKPSQDCHLCRSRRVKCDLARPSCQRCTKYGAECPGYRDQLELVFRNANAGAKTKSVPANKRKKRVQPAVDCPSLTPPEHSPSPSSSSSSSSSSSADDESNVSVVPYKNKSFDAASWGYPLPQPLTEHWTAHSVPIILDVYSTLDFIHDIYHSNAQNGPLLWAAHLFSRTYVTNLRYSTTRSIASQDETDHELGGYLSKTLSSVNAALRTPDGAARNDVLATVWILANYELLIGSLDRVEVSSAWHLHSQGLYSILKSRGTESLRTQAGRMAFWPAFNMVQVHCLVANIDCPPETEEWLQFIKETMNPHEGLALNVALFVNKVAHIQSRILEMLKARNFLMASSEYEKLVGEMTMAEWDMNDFITSNTHLKHTTDPYMHNLRYSNLVKGYHVMHMLANFMTHYAPCKIPLDQLTSYRAYCLQVSRDNAQKILDHTPEAIETLAKDKFKSPSVLFDAVKLIWPLTVVYLMPSTLLEQKREAEAALKFIGREIGVRQALNIYNAVSYLPLEAKQPLGVHEGTYGDLLSQLGPSHSWD